MTKTLTLICMLFIMTGIKAQQASRTGTVKDSDTSSGVTITILPANPLIEKDDYGQYMNFDISIKNTGKHTLNLATVEVSVRDINTNLFLRKSINSTGRQPSIRILGNTIIKPNTTINIFNPFDSFAPDLDIAYMDYKFFFDYGDNETQRTANLGRLPMDYDLSIVKVVTPEIYTPKTNLTLPLKGKLIVWDGHDVHSLHRRFSTGSPAWRKKGITANSNRYAYDLVNINQKGEMYQGDPFTIENWFVFNKPVYAPAAGTVVDIQNDVPDNTFEKKNVTHTKLFNLTDPSVLGNYVIIDNGNGEFTALLHMEKGSIKVKVGEAVRQGQQVGNVGFSGDAIVPHLHVALMRGQKVMASEGVPSYFINYKLYHGNHVSSVKKGRIDSGDIIEGN